MKKIVCFLVLFCALVMSVAADGIPTPDNTAALAFLKEPYRPYSSRSKAMGGVGMVFPEDSQSIWMNPAGLAAQEFTFSLPAAVLSFRSSAPTETPERINYQSFPIAYITQVSEMGGYLDNYVFAGSMALTLKGFGFAFSAGYEDHRYVPDDYLDGTRYMDNCFRIPIDFRIGYGHRFNLADSLSLDAGFTLGVNFSYYVLSHELLKVDEAGYKTYPWTGNSHKTYRGVSFPVNLGLRLNHSLGFAFATTLDNINGRYYATELDSSLNSTIDILLSSTSNKASFSTDFSWNIGLGWTLPDRVSRLFHVTVEADFVDINGLITDKDFSASGILSHVRAGAEAGVSVVRFRAGYDRGGYSTGFCLDLWAFRLETTYVLYPSLSTREFDWLDVAINFGW